MVCVLSYDNGSDTNPGTSSAPWKTLSKVQTSAAAGDVIVIQYADAATYNAAWPTHASYQANVVRRFEISWTFDTYHTVGQFANRDHWVIGPVKIIGFSPASTSVSGRIINGSMVNPAAGFTSQGYDSAMPSNTHSSALNVAYGRSASNPLTLAAGSSLISSISLSTVGAKTTLQRAAILTVLGSAPAAGSFRPPYCGTDKIIRFNKAALDCSLLRSLSPVASTPAMSTVEGWFAAPWIDHRAGWSGGQMHPRDNMPVVTSAGRQTQPAVAATGTTLHLLWASDERGDPDIYYAALEGLPPSPVVGVNIIDDTSGADQTAPAVACSDERKVFACWLDARHADGTGADRDLYVAELRSGRAGTNLLVGDDGFNCDQNDPALGVDRHGQPYVVWTDYRRITAEIYWAATTLIDPVPLDAKTIAAAAGGLLGTDPAAIKTVGDVSIAVPPGACRTDLHMAIARVLNPQLSNIAVLDSYEFSPSGVQFEQPITITIPYAVTPQTRRILPFWYDSVTGALSQQGITEVETYNLTPHLNALRFRTTHFTPFHLVEVDAGGEPLGTAGGGCAMAPAGGGSPAQLLVPYTLIAGFLLFLRRRDRRNRAHLHPGP